MGGGPPGLTRKGAVTRRRLPCITWLFEAECRHEVHEKTKPQESMAVSRQPEDKKEARCPLLGHLVPFPYCTACSEGLPCRKIVDCWSHEMDVQEYLGSRFTPGEISAILAPPKPKMVQLIEMARKAASRKP